MLTIGIDHVLDSRFRVLQHIHSDGAGPVYDALDERTGEVVRLRVPVGPVDHRLLGILHEGLARPQCIAADDAYVVLQDLDDLPVVAGGPESALQRLQDLMASILPLFEDLHANGIVHGTVGPGSFWRDAYGGIRVTDLGLPNFDPDERTTCPVADADPLDPRVDVYALAATLIHLATGESPQDALCSAPLPELVLRALGLAMDPRPALRPIDASALRRELEDAIHLSTTPTPEELGEPSTMETVPTAPPRSLAPESVDVWFPVVGALIGGGTALIAGSTLLLTGVAVATLLL